jgi:hypothetical protein
MKFSIHTNRRGITATFPETRNTVFFQVGFSFWNWAHTIKGPFLFILYRANCDGVSLAGPFAVTWGAV